jgi:hypothetical protein
MINFEKEGGKREVERVILINSKPVVAISVNGIFILVSMSGFAVSLTMDNAEATFGAGIHRTPISCHLILPAYVC